MSSPFLSSHAFVVAFFFNLVLQLSLGSVEEHLFHDCSPFYSMYGDQNISYPFTNTAKADCGLCIIQCNWKFKPEIHAEDEGEAEWYEVKGIDYRNKTIVIHDKTFTRLIKENRCDELYNFSTPPFCPHLSWEQIGPDLTIYICKGDPTTHLPESYDGTWGFRDCQDYDLHFTTNVTAETQLPPSPSTNSSDCRVVKYPVHEPRPSSSHQETDLLLSLLHSGFHLGWSLSPPCHLCEKNGTLCLEEQNQEDVTCVDPKYHQDEQNEIKSNKAEVWWEKIIIAIVSSFIFVISLVAVLVYYLRRKLSSNGYYGLMPFWKRRTRNTQNVESFLKTYGSLAPKRYSYSDIKKMTNSFKEKVGQGGYGGVFKGKLPDGRLVAVKVLNDSKGNGEEFINEVASISRTSHVNIVTFLGFCFDASKRALIYEFMSNGSLEKFIYKEKTCPHLGWERLQQIALGIAHGLEYLHRGCSTRILHFDIKPHNILLDEDFCPKISDFGLAKLCPRKDSAISMADARGTIGYIAPEVFSRNFGGVSHKVDVYSYGMMVLEMVGGRRNIDARVDHTSEVYFPHWIYKQIEQGEHLRLNMVTREEEEEIARKMVLVGLWCIQMDPTNRPSMSRVVDMLGGNLEVLPIPPKPFLFST